MSIKNKKILAITLARGGSKGIKKKNLRKIANKPLIDYTINEANKSTYIDRYIVSTDDQEIQNYCINKNVDVPFLRPSYLASDIASSTDALQHAVNFCEKYDGKYDIIVELMCTNPFKTSLDIDNCIQMLIDNNADSVIGVFIILFFPNLSLNPSVTLKTPPYSAISCPKIITFESSSNLCSRQSLIAST